MIIIQLRNYTKKYKNKTVLSNLNLEIQKGDMIAITGPSGAGKSVLLNTIGLIEDLTEGELILFGKKAPKINSIESNKIIRDKISYLFQNFALVEHKSVEDNLYMALKYTNLNKEEKKQLVKEALEKVGLDNYEKNFIYELSGGEQQRISLARSIIKPNEIILADEPTGALDTKNRDLIINLLKEVNQLGRTIVIVTHDEVVANSCNKIIKI
ncbi:putative bacteriocin export ABC transporter (plasmid) [Vagococcus carniphilus]|uniref:Bacteriocin ABC transporter ATP-binding protein n=1 Tax=Vagococcus carniphilus TaxID=218144 RepID=A0A430AR44_9ENTE|nr:putative bacteriocin export ABC transporter [Vagococcus carniphilus]QNN74532.1 putative bacteriocin export ABC transporter [Vagococcus carniphilus]RSU10394.1 bacteriocin ABC transporter ATP-binding protein [Vagococcus carniphilus]